MNRRTWVSIVATIFIWTAVVAGCAYRYVTEHLALPDLEGYEREWDWQLLFFALTQLPGLLLVLLILVLVELRFLKE